MFQDKILNSYGKKLLNLCSALSIYILNGTCDGDKEGRYTFISDQGSSVNYYFLASVGLFDFLKNKITLSVMEKIESDHMPLALCIGKQNELCDNGKDVNIDKNDFIIKYRWNLDYANNFIASMFSMHVQERLNVAVDMININVNDALETLNDIFKEQARNMRKKIMLNKTVEQRNWFDYECRVKKREVRGLLRICTRTLNLKGMFTCFCKKLTKLKLSPLPKNYNSNNNYKK